jgi:hypothetical protein
VTTDPTQEIKAKILKVLEIYPRISPSMLQIGIGPQYKAEAWRPVLEALVSEGLVAQDDIADFSVTGRYQLYKVLHLVVA